MKRYPAYKDSGIEWLGEIPAGWELQKLKRLADIFFSNVDKKTYDSEMDVLLCNYLDVYRNDFITKNMSFMHVALIPTLLDQFSPFMCMRRACAAGFFVYSILELF